MKTAINEKYSLMLLNPHKYKMHIPLNQHGSYLHTIIFKKYIKSCNKFFKFIRWYNSVFYSAKYFYKFKRCFYVTRVTSIIINECSNPLSSIAFVSFCDDTQIVYVNSLSPATLINDVFRIR